jgi:hypothetical protein
MLGGKHGSYKGGKSFHTEGHRSANPGRVTGGHRENSDLSCSGKAL